ncbi:MAG TPA: 4-hydroxythreonine-4-phosphate dehydrogenase PdxA [Nitrospirota bacterium]|nr:4-hydroxythreonine-4-phosphate dehydrogenase PdxA [Nitrospirota bacterium]
MTSEKPLLAVTMGDPAGIGPEIIAKTAADAEIASLCELLVIGDAGVMRKQIADSGSDLSVHVVDRVEEATFAAGLINLFDMNMIDTSRHRWGQPDAASGKAVVEYIRKAVTLALNREVEAIVTAPLNKEVMNAAGHHYAGHTELLAELTGATEYGMLFVGGGLRVILATIHAALKDVPQRITHASLMKTFRLAQRALVDFGIERPRIGVAALNPHAGEGGLFGREENEIMLPAILEARSQGIQVSDPLPADTLFYKALHKHYDIVAAMYHDQGLAPLKMLAFGRSVNITVGLPITRTSVDHGTAYDIAGRGCADPASLREAIKVAVDLSLQRSRRAQS